MYYYWRFYYKKRRVGTHLSVWSRHIIVPVHSLSCARRVWRYKRVNLNAYIAEEQPTHWPKEKVQKDKQLSTKHTHKAKDLVTRIPLKTRGELRCSTLNEITTSIALKISNCVMQTLVSSWYIKWPQVCSIQSDRYTTILFF